MRLLKAFLGNHVLANLTFVLVLVIGLITYTQMPRERDPTINFNWIQITTIFPGASAQDVETRITNQLEDALRKISDVRFVSSISRDSVSSILVRFNELDDAVFSKRVNDLRREVQNKEKELPPEVESPHIIELTSANGFPSATLVVFGNSHPDQLRVSARNIKKDLERVQGIDSVDPIGFMEPEIQIYFDPQTLAQYGISPTALAQTVQRHYQDTSAGALSVDHQRWVIRWVGSSIDPNEIAKYPIMTSFGELPLGKIATVQSGREKPTTIAKYQGSDAVLFSIKKQANVNDLQLLERIKQYIETQQLSLQQTGIGIALVDDQTEMTKDALAIMQTNAVYGLLLVLFSTWLFLGMRIAVLISIGIPFTLAATFWSLSGLGQTLNISVLLGVVICLGMLVDDSVVVVEAIYFRLQRGMDKMQSTLEGLKEVFAPVTTSILTTVSAFLPLMLLPGILGKFMMVIPMVVCLALLFSLVEAYWMLPAHINGFNVAINQNARMQRYRNQLTNFIRSKYLKSLILVLRHPKKTLLFLMAVFIFSIAAIALNLVKVNFFASDPIRLFFVNVEMPNSTFAQTTVQYTQAVEQKIKQHLQTEELNNTASYAGMMFTETEAVFGEHVGQIMVSLKPELPGTRTVDEMIESMRQDVTSTLGPVNVSFLRMAGGPPTSKPINMKVRGDDFEQIRAALTDIKSILQEIPSISDIADNDTQGQPELILKPNYDMLNRLKVDPAEIARITRLLVDGEVVGATQHEGEKLKVRVLAHPQDLQSINHYLSLALSTSGERPVRLSDLVSATYENGQSSIKHYNFKKTITVTAEIDKQVIDTVTANQMIKDQWNNIRSKHPAIDLNFSGELDDIEESIQAMPKLFLIGLGLMYLLLGTQFRSYWQPLLILSTVPLAFCGVIFGLVFTQNPLSLYTLYGIVALSGIAVNAAIVLISAANQRLTQGMNVVHATLYAARRRVIPILITSLTTISGLMSLALGLGGKSLLWGPVATAIVWGLGFSTILTLLVIPLLYQFFMRHKAPNLSVFQRSRTRRFGILLLNFFAKKIMRKRAHVS